MDMMVDDGRCFSQDEFVRRGVGSAGEGEKCSCLVIFGSLTEYIQKWLGLPDILGNASEYNQLSPRHGQIFGTVYVFSHIFCIL
jgi:hypothetical protein